MTKIKANITKTGKNIAVTDIVFADTNAPYGVENLNYLEEGDKIGDIECTSQYKRKGVNYWIFEYNEDYYYFSGEYKDKVELVRCSLSTNDRKVVSSDEIQATLTDKGILLDHPTDDWGSIIIDYDDIDSSLGLIKLEVCHFQTPEPYSDLDKSASYDREYLYKLNGNYYYAVADESDCELFDEHVHNEDILLKKCETESVIRRKQSDST